MPFLSLQSPSILDNVSIVGASLLPRQSQVSDSFLEAHRSISKGMEAHEGVLSLAAPASSPPTTPSPATTAPCPLHKGFPVLHLQPQAGLINRSGIRGKVIPSRSCMCLLAWQQPGAGQPSLPQSQLTF